MGEPEHEEKAAATPSRRLLRWRAALARTPRHKLVLGGAALGVAVLLLAVLVWLASGLPSTAKRGQGGPTAASSPGAAQPSGSSGATPYTIFAWRDDKGVVRRAAVDAARHDEFVAAERRLIDQDKRELIATQTTKLRVELAPVFEEIEDRVPAYADWVFDWWTSWILLARTFGWTWDALLEGRSVTLPDKVQAQLVAAIQEQFLVRVLKPETTEPKVTAAIDLSLAAVRDELLRDCAKYQQAYGDFVRREARQVERRDPAQGWLPDGQWNRDGAAFQPLCESVRAADEATLRAAFLNLVEVKNAEGPVNDVVLRMARPFATKLISFVVLPVIVAALLGGIVLPLFGLLPSVLSNVVTGVLTGAAGALVIGFSASASVDWLLNRTDAAFSRAGFEVSVRKAVIAAQGDFGNRVIDAERQSIEQQLQAMTAMLAGEIPAP